MVMGRLVSGINGPFIGKVGTIIGSTRNGIPYIKGPHKYRTKNISEKEKLNRSKFAAAQLWLSPLINFVRIGFNGYSKKGEGFIAAKSYLLKNALKVENNGIIIDPALVKLSFGDLPMSANAAFKLSAPGELTFTWEPEGIGYGYDRDQVMMLAYNCTGYEKKFSVSYENITGQFRSAGQDILLIPKDLKAGTIFHVYIAFIAADRSRQSDSLYLGELRI